MVRIERLSNFERSRRQLFGNRRVDARIEIEKKTDPTVLFGSRVELPGVSDESPEKKIEGKLPKSKRNKVLPPVQEIETISEYQEESHEKIYLGDQRVKCIDEARGTVVPFENQPPENQRPSAENNDEKENRKENLPPPKPHVAKEKNKMGLQKLRDSIMMDKNIRKEEKRKTDAEKEKSFRVFDCLALEPSNKKSTTSMINSPRRYFPNDNFNFTPIRGTRCDAANSRLSSIATSPLSQFCPGAVSTPIEKVMIPRTTGKKSFNQRKTSINDDDEVFENASDADNKQKSIDEGQNEETEYEERTANARPADCSISDIMVTPEEKENNEDLKRKRSKRSDEMVAEKSINQNTEIGKYMETMEVEMETENDQTVEKRKTIQPQEQQFLKESRLSVATSSCSRRNSINSLMEEISLDDQNMEYMTSGIESTLTIVDSRAPTAMTIHIDDPSMVPYYLEEMDVGGIGSSYMEQLLHVAGQTKPMYWEDFPDGTLAANVKKLGEGAYGEVFSATYDGKPVAIKIVPFVADTEEKLLNGCQMPKSEMILPEAVVTKELSALNNLCSENSAPNFINLVASHIVMGDYPAGLLEAWDLYAKRKESLNDRPDLYASSNQCFVTFVTENGGVDLESFKVNNEKEVRSILIQLILSLVVAENVLEFEHRDLHAGNVLIKRTDEASLNYKVRGNNVSLTSYGVKVSIIDFTLSRIRKKCATVYQNLETDPSIFEGTGHEQYEIYRSMRRDNGGNWQTFTPSSNIKWVQFLAKEMIKTPICPAKAIPTKRKNILKKLFDRLGKFESCGDTFTDPEFYNDFYEGYLDHVEKENQ